MYTHWAVSAASVERNAAALSADAPIAAPAASLPALARNPRLDTRSLAIVFDSPPAFFSSRPSAGKHLVHLALASLSHRVLPRSLLVAEPSAPVPKTRSGVRPTTGPSVGGLGSPCRGCALRELWLDSHRSTSAAEHRRWRVRTSLGCACVGAQPLAARSQVQPHYRERPDYMQLFASNQRSSTATAQAILTGAPWFTSPAMPGGQVGTPRCVPGVDSQGADGHCSDSSDHKRQLTGENRAGSILIAVNRLRVGGAKSHHHGVSRQR